MALTIFKMAIITLVMSWISVFVSITDKVNQGHIFAKYWHGKHDSIAVILLKLKNVKKR